MEDRQNILLVLRSGGDFGIRDVELIARHINGKWQGSTLPRIICLWDKASCVHDLGNFELHPYMPMGTYGTWDRIRLYAPSMEEFKPFLYVDLDTAIVRSLENIINLVVDKSKFIVLEDFWQRGQLATGLVWFPKNCPKTQAVYKEFVKPTGSRMDTFIRKVSKQDLFWQDLTKGIVDFKPKTKTLLTSLPKDTDVVCFHGKPRIFDAQSIKWVKDYVQTSFPCRFLKDHKVTVIIPYKWDRGWLKEAIMSVPEGVQLLVSQGEGNWPENFNKVLDQATGDYIKWLHEDDRLTENSITDSVNAIIEQGVDFIHGNAVEVSERSGKRVAWKAPTPFPSLRQMLQKNIIHSATLMYRREVFEKVGRLNEGLNTAEEYEFNLRCLKHGLKIGYCDADLAIYRRHPQQKVRVVPEADRKKERNMVKSLYV